MTDSCRSQRSRNIKNDFSNFVKLSKAVRSQVSCEIHIKYGAAIAKIPYLLQRAFGKDFFPGMLQEHR